MEQIFDQILNLDNKVLIFIQEYIRDDSANTVFIWLYKAGKMGIVWIVLSVVLLLWHRTRKTGAVSLLALLCAWFISGYLLSGYVQRPVPGETLSYAMPLVSAAGYSFPSLCASMAYASSVFIYKNGPRTLGLFCVIFAAVISAAELYVGACYPTDTLCGAVIGIILGIIMYWLFGDKWSRKKRRH